MDVESRVVRAFAAYQTCTVFAQKLCVRFICCVHNVATTALSLEILLTLARSFCVPCCSSLLFFSLLLHSTQNNAEQSHIHAHINNRLHLHIYPTHHYRQHALYSDRLDSRRPRGCSVLYRRGRHLLGHLRRQLAGSINRCRRVDQLHS